MISIEEPNEVQAIESIYNQKENKKIINALPEDFFSIFRGLYSKFCLNNSLYYGRSPVKDLFQSNSKVITAPAMTHLNELKSFIQNNTRMPYLFSYNKNIDQSYIDIINEALINSYSANNINKSLIDAWMDYMINGIGILKFVGEYENLISADVIPPSNVVFDFTDLDKPQFFIYEKIMSTEEACKEYRIDQKEFNFILGKPSKPKILKSMQSWDNTISEWFNEPSSGKELKKKNIQDIFTEDFTSKIVYEKPNISVNIIREEYKRCNFKEGDKVVEIYQKNVFLNNYHVSTTNINSENFPFIILHNIKKDTMNLEDAFPCFIDQVRSDILLYNNLYCLQLDGLTSASAGSSLVIINPDAIEDGANISNKSESKLNLIKVKTGIDKSINDVVTKTSPIDLSQSIQNEMQLCMTRIRSCTGLLNFETPMKSGYQESLRLDREMANISYWVTSIDDAIMKIGRLMKGILLKFLNEESATVSKFLSNPEILDKDMCNILKSIIKDSVNGVMENKDAYTYKNKIINDLVTLRDLTGEAILFDVKKLASDLRMPQEVIDSISNNSPDPEKMAIEKQVIVGEIEKVKTDSIKNLAMADKYKAEAEYKIKESKETTKKESTSKK